MKRYARLADWPILLKVLVAPCICLLAMGTALMLGIAGLNRGVDTTTLLGNARDSVEQLHHVEAGVQGINGDLYHLLTLQAAKTPGLKPAESLKSLNEETDRVADLLRVWQTEHATPQQTLRTKVLIDDILKYKGAINWVGQMLDQDFGSAVSFLHPFDDNFKELSASLAAIVHEEVVRQQEEGDGAVALLSKVRKNFVVLALCGLAAAVLVAFVMTFNLSRAVRSIAEVTSRLAAGDTDLQPEKLARRDELGAVVSALSIFRENLVRVAALRHEQAEQADRSEADRRRMMQETAGAFERNVGVIMRQVADAASTMQGSAQTMSGSAHEALQQVEQVATSAEQADGGVQRVAAAATQLAASIGEISRQVQGAAITSREAVESARGTHSTVKELAEAAARISQVTELINTIASQTKLLALNATIEAARAGESGRGFAVVASEVKMLAQRTADATSEIGQQISHIQAATETAVGEIGSISQRVEELSTVSIAIAEAVERQGSATSEIARHVQATATGMKHVTAAMDKVNGAVETTRDTSQDVLRKTAELSHNARQMISTVENFVQGIKAA